MISKSRLTWLNIDNLIIFCIILLGVSTRLIPHPPNFVPIAAIALFGSAMLPKAGAWILPLSIMIISDSLLGFHEVIAYTWGSYALISLLGFLLLRQNRSIKKTASLILLSSILFFAITNFGVWATSTWYEASLSGLIECYTVAIPFFRNTLLGDLFYTTLFFGSYALISTFFLNFKTKTADKK